MTTITINVPVALKERAQETVKALSKRAKKLGLTFGATFGPQTDAVIDGRAVKCITVTVLTSTLKISGWTLVAKIEHLATGKNIITPAWGHNEDTPQFRESGCGCDHCHTSRFRKNLFGLKNEETGELIQVGSTCIKDFIGVSPASLLSSMSLMHEISDAIEDGFVGGNAGVHVIDFLANTDILARANGFVTAAEGRDRCIMSTGDVAWENSFMGRPASWDEHVQIAEKICDHIEAIEASTDFIHNLKAMIEVGYITFKHRNTLAYAWVIYQKHLDAKARKAAGKASKPVGRPGERIRGIKATLVYKKLKDSLYGTTTIYVFRTDGGDTLVWYASRDHMIETGQEVTMAATVKRHAERDGEISTIITRAKFE